MIAAWLQVLKLTALALLVGLVAIRWLDVLDAVTLAVAALYLLFVRVT